MLLHGSGEGAGQGLGGFGGAGAGAGARPPRQGPPGSISVTPDEMEAI